MVRLLSTGLLAWTLLGCSSPAPRPGNASIEVHERPRVLAAAERALSAAPLTITAYPA